MKFFIQMVLRNLRSYECRLLFIALVLAVATMTSISLFSNRIKQTIFEEAAQFLGGDIKLSGSLELPKEIETLINNYSLNSSKHISFRAMAFANDEMRLTQVKAVDNQYPLKGKLEITTTKDNAISTLTYAPQKNEAFINEALKNALQVNIGDEITIGEKKLLIKAIVLKEPDNVQSNFSFGPRIIMAMSDVPATSAVQTGSRINYSTLVAGDSSSIEQLKVDSEPYLDEHIKWTDANNRRDRIGTTLSKAERFLLLAGALSLLLTGTAIALAAKQFAEQQRSYVALYKTFGFSKSRIFGVYLSMMFLLGIIGSIIGAILGWVLHILLVHLLSDLLPSNLASAEYSAYIFASLSGLFALLAFSCIPLMTLQKVTPLSILRNQQLHNIPFRLSLFIGYLSILILAWLLTSSLAMTSILTLGLIALVASTYITIRISFRIFHLLVKKLNHHRLLSLVSKNFTAHRNSHILQSLIFSIIFMLVAILIEIRSGLLERWKAQTPEDAANYFAFNIFPEDMPFLKEIFSKNTIKHSPFYPMTRGRILSINGDPIKHRVENHQGQMNYERELNLTWSTELGADNEIIEGQWWTSNQLAQKNTFFVSAEEEYARGAGMKLGDMIVFSLAGSEFTAELTNIRSVKWDSMNPNFFMMFDKSVSNNTQTNWLTSFYLPDDKNTLATTIAKTNPGISLLALEQTIQQIRGIIQQVSRGIEFILFLILCSGILVLILSIKASVDERKKDTAIILSMGAGRKLIQSVLRCEFIVLGFLSGLIASAAAEVSLFFVQTRLFDLGFSLHLWMWLSLPVSAAILITLIGNINTRQVVRTPPMQVLREI